MAKTKVNIPNYEDMVYDPSTGNLVEGERSDWRQKPPILGPQVRGEVTGCRGALYPKGQDPYRPQEATDDPEDYDVDQDVTSVGKNIKPFNHR